MCRPDVELLCLPEAAWTRETDRLVHLLAIRRGQGRQDRVNARPQRSAPSKQRRLRQRRKEERDAKVGVPADRPGCFPDHLEDQRSGRRPCNLSQNRSDHGGACQEIDVPGVGKIGEARDVARLGGADFEKAGYLSGERDAFGRYHHSCE
jgi:hypothetical protein